MDYFLKKKKWMACLVLLTFLFTSIMPSNLGSMNSIAEASVSSQIGNYYQASQSNGSIGSATVD
ncbi:MAG: hypothetical protein IIU81_05660, partial [Peptococcaceae bacterium]|nr:hypothetical protein [Peptococcaceae bacterium]